MKRLILIFSLILFLSVPLTVLAWPTVLHDDGGPYQDLAVAEIGHYLTTAVLTPSSVELTILNSAGNHVAWTSFVLADYFQSLSTKRLFLQTLINREGRQLIYIAVVGKENDLINSAGFFSAELVSQDNSPLLIPSAELVTLPTPPNARDLVVSIGERQIYLLWRTETEDGISSVLINRLNRWSAIANINH